MLTSSLTHTSLGTGQRGLLFEVEYPDAEPGLQPRHRFMSAFEQRVEAADKGPYMCVYMCMYLCSTSYPSSRCAIIHILTVSVVLPFLVLGIVSCIVAWQYVVIACDPYENIGFKIPNAPIDRGENRIVSIFDAETGKFSLKFFYE